MCVYIYTHIYMYIYVEKKPKERRGEEKRENEKKFKKEKEGKKEKRKKKEGKDVKSRRKEEEKEESPERTKKEVHAHASGVYVHPRRMHLGCTYTRDSRGDGGGEEKSKSNPAEDFCNAITSSFFNPRNNHLSQERSLGKQEVSVVAEAEVYVHLAGEVRGVGVHTPRAKTHRFQRFFLRFVQNIFQQSSSQVSSRHNHSKGVYLERIHESFLPLGASELLFFSLQLPRMQPRLQPHSQTQSPQLCKKNLQNGPSKLLRSFRTFQTSVIRIHSTQRPLSRRHLAILQNKKQFFVFIFCNFNFFFIIYF